MNKVIAASALIMVIVLSPAVHAENCGPNEAWDSGLSECVETNTVVSTPASELSAGTRTEGKALAPNRADRKDFDRGFREESSSRFKNTASVGTGVNTNGLGGVNTVTGTSGNTNTSNSAAGTTSSTSSGGGITAAGSR